MLKLRAIEESKNPSPFIYVVNKRCFLQALIGNNSAMNVPLNSKALPLTWRAFVPSEEESQR